MKYFHGEALHRLLPGAALVFPDGPIDLGHGFRGWWPIQGGSDAEQETQTTAHYAPQVAQQVRRYLNDLKWNLGVPGRRVVLAGFSQGATVAFYTALTRQRPLGGLFAVSGAAFDRLDEPSVRLPLYLVVGEKERGEYSGVPHLVRSVPELQKKGFKDIKGHVEPGVEHAHAVTRGVLGRLARFSNRVVDSPEPQHQPAQAQQGWGAAAFAPA